MGKAELQFVFHVCPAPQSKVENGELKKRQVVLEGVLKSSFLVWRFVKF